MFVDFSWNMEEKVFNRAEDSGPLCPAVLFLLLYVYDTQREHSNLSVFVLSIDSERSRLVHLFPLPSARAISPRVRHIAATHSKPR